MPRTLPPLPWLLAFEAAARHLSMTAAARELGLTQSAISQQIRLLEHRFDTRLFKRQPKGLELTDAGRRLLPKVAEAIDGVSQIAAEFDPGQQRQPLTVAASMSFTRSYIVPGLPGFLNAHPEAELRLSSTLWPDEFSRSEADIEISFTTARQAGAGARQLCADEVIAVVAPGVLPVDASWDDICGADRIEIVGTGQTWERWSRAVSHPAPSGRVQLVDSHDLALEMACAGVGVTLNSRLLSAPLLQSGDLVQPVALSVPTQEGYYLSHGKVADKPLAEHFVAWIEQNVQRAKAGFAEG